MSSKSTGGEVEKNPLIHYHMLQKDPISRGIYEYTHRTSYLNMNEHHTKTETVAAVY